MTKVDRSTLVAFVTQFSLVRRVIRLIDGELVHGGLPEMIGEPWRLQVEFAVRDTIGERAVEFGKRALHAEQSRQPRRFGSITTLLQRQLARDQVQRVDRDPQIEGIMSADHRRDIVAQEIRDRVDQLGGCRFVLHIIFPRRASSRNRSISVSEARRPIIARSMDCSSPRDRRIMPQHITPQRSVPITSQNFTRFASTRRPAASYPANSSSRVPKPPTGLSISPKRQELTQTHPRSSMGSPVCASSQSSTARTPSGPMMRLPWRKSPCTSVTSSEGPGSRSRNQRNASSNTGRGHSKLR